MPPLDLDRRPIAKARAELEARRADQRAAGARHHAAQAELERLRRSGADAGLLREQEAQVAGLAQAARGAITAADGALAATLQLQEGLLAHRDPALLVEALGTEHPVLLLPVALQTRYDDALTQLMIRIYPDAPHTWQHDPGLTEAEAEAGQRYWRERYAAPAEPALPWQAIALAYGPMRAAYLVQATTPLNVAAIGQEPEPQFDPGAWPASAAEGRRPAAAALPDRFVAIGWRHLRGGAAVEMFRVWGRAVADWLPLAPSFDPLQAAGGAAAWQPFDGDRAWLVDYAAAVEAGMAITVTARDLKNGAKLSDPVDGLVVLGVDWTQTPESAAALVGSLFDNHAHGDGLSFVAQGTPSNNTGAGRAGFAANGADLQAALAPEATAARAEAAADELASAGARLQALLGLPKAAFDAGRLPGAALQEGATSAHMQNALWNATLGFTLRYFWNPLDQAETLVSDAAIEQLRAHAVRYLRPSGPLSTLRFGRQPYGLLPVAARGFQPKANSALERELLQALEWFRGAWTAALTGVPSLADPSPESLHNVLAMQPWAAGKRFWQVVGPAAIANYPEIKDHASAQAALMRLVTETLLDGKPGQLKQPFLATCAVKPKPHPLDAVPWVQRDPDHPQRERPDAARLAPDYLATLIELLGRPTAEIRRPLVAMQAGESLLEAMLAFAVDEELTQSGRRLFSSHIQRLPDLAADVKARASHWRYAEFSGVDLETPLGDQVDIGSASALMGLQLVGTTGDQSIEGWIGSWLGRPRLEWPEQLRNVASLAESLGFLQQATVGELGLALRSTLDLASNRLDAWITSLATKRLDEMREKAPLGLHLGAWGIVEGLRPDRGARGDDSLGYVHAPSIQQATTAAILRSGHLANREQAGNAFDIDLRSHRVKRARRLLEGLANGQAMAALLGYRFERALHAADLPQHILEFRRAFPLVPAGETAADEPGDAIAARNVADGVRLVAEYREKGIAGITPAGVPAADQPRLAAAIDELADQLDAVADLLIADSVHHIAGGNLDAAGASMQAIDQQQRPPETRVADTPHATRGYAQRVVVALQSSDAPDWPADLAARVEPRLNAWLARLLGAPTRYRCFARVLHPVEAPPVDGRPQQGWDDRGETLEIGFEALGLSPLALVLGSEVEQGAGRSAVQERLALALGEAAKARFGAEADALALVLDAEAPADAPAGTLGLVAFESYAWLLRRLLERVRPLRRMDLVRAVDGIETEATLNDGEHAGVDLAELQARLAIAQAEADAVLAALDGALAPFPDDLDEVAVLDAADPTVAAQRDALVAALGQAHALGWRAAIATAGVATATADGAGDGDSEGTRVAAPDSLAGAVARGRALRAEVAARLEAAPPPSPTDADGAAVPFAVQAEATVARVKAILGKAFPLLPLFTLGSYAGEAGATLGDRDTLFGKADLGHDDWLVAGWLPKLGCVREAVGRLADVLTAAEAQGLDAAPEDFKLLQFPRDPAAHWGALPPARRVDADGREVVQDLRGCVAVVAHAPAALDAIAPGDGFAGLFVDEWSESLPPTHEKTAIGFHFDAPGARPPQSLLLAVPADPAAANWTLDALVDTVREAMSLARLRLVRQKDLKGTGLVLPGIFLSQGFTKDVPSLDFGQLAAKGLAHLKLVEGVAAGAAARIVDGKLHLKA